MSGKTQTILIVIAEFYEHIAKLQLDGATAILKKQNIPFDIIKVPGALEIPAVISVASDTGHYAGYIALGCVIRGETTHYDIVANESARALMDLSTHKNLAIGNGILTVENEEQALVRADAKQMDKAGGAAIACLEMISIINNFKAHI